jgi:hypothetical protein
MLCFPADLDYFVCFLYWVGLNLPCKWLGLVLWLSMVSPSWSIVKPGADFSPWQKCTDFCPRHPQTADNHLASLFFTWHQHRRWLATGVKCFVVLLGSPADGRQMFLVTHGSFIHVTSGFCWDHRRQRTNVFCPRTIVQNIKHVWSAKTLFQNKSCFFLPADDGFCARLNTSVDKYYHQTTIRGLSPPFADFAEKNTVSILHSVLLPWCDFRHRVVILDTYSGTPVLTRPTMGPMLDDRVAAVLASVKLNIWGWSSRKKTAYRSIACLHAWLRWCTKPFSWEKQLLLG